MADVQKVNLIVEGMSCNHCVASVKNHISSLPGVESVDVSLADGKVAVSGYGINADFLVREIDALGYRARIGS